MKRAALAFGRLGAWANRRLHVKVQLSRLLFYPVFSQTTILLQISDTEAPTTNSAKMADADASRVFKRKRSAPSLVFVALEAY